MKFCALTEARKVAIDYLREFSGYVLPPLALVILGLCLGALLGRRNQDLGKIRIVNTANGDVFPITGRETSLGRHKNCDIVLNYETVSKQQAVIICKKDGWYIKKVSGAAAEIKVNGNTVEKPAMLKTGDIIQLGGVKLLFENHANGR